MFPGTEIICCVMATESKETIVYKYPPSKPPSNPPRPSTTTPFIPTGSFPFLELPYEIRLQMYSYLLPPCIHKIAPALTHPYGPTLTPPLSFKAKAKPYKILTTNLSPSYPHPKIHTTLLTLSRQIHAETIPLLYGPPSTVFDFGTSLELIPPFFADCGNLARRSVKNLRVGRELKLVRPSGDRLWCKFMSELKEMSGLKKIDLTFWSETGRGDFLPPKPLSCASLLLSSSSSISILEKQRKAEEEQLWRSWSWTSELFKLDGLTGLSIKTWVFRNAEAKGRKIDEGNGKEGFDYWLACRMVSDQGLRGRAVWDGIVEEERVVLRL